jgi:hypothetical protein
VLRCDGLLPVCMDDNGFRATTPDDIVAMRSWLADRGWTGGDVVMEGETPADEADKAAAIVGPWIEARCTWWLDARWQVEASDRPRIVTERLEAGPPRP